MARQMEDPVFGTLTFSSLGWDNSEAGYWERPEYLDVLGATVPLQVNTAGGEPTQEQREAYLTFEQAQGRLRSDLEAALFAFYQSEREVYIDVMDEADLDWYIAECAPPIERPDEVWNLLTPEYCAVRGPWNDEAGAGDTMICWHGSWDVEHEFYTHFQSGKLLGVEAMGGIFYAYPPEGEP